MLYNLRVENIALIDKLNIEFGEGLNVLSGETGAGKSIIINSMNLILGERADRDLIRTGCDKSLVEAIFYIEYDRYKSILEELGIEKSDELIVSRELSTSGRNICRINGNAVNLSGLKKLMTEIVDIHSQNSNQMLLNPTNHIKLLDSYLGSGIIDLKSEISERFRKLRKLKRRLKELGGSKENRQRGSNVLLFQINELEQADVETNEIKNLENEKEVLVNAQKISDALNDSYEILYTSNQDRSVISSLSICDDKLSRISEYSPQYEKAAERIRDYLYGIEELAHDLNGYKEEINSNEQRINKINERQNFIKSLFRKYNVHTEEELKQFLEAAREKLNDFNSAESEIEKIGAEIVEERIVLDKLYETLTEKRKSAASQLEDLINRELKDLGMVNAVFTVKIEKDPKYKYKENGIDTTEFFISTNLGEPSKPLSKIASGGEISRIMLALKNIFGRSVNTSTLIFDEIDTGISGEMALTVADKLASIALEKQVICVSHLPQIAVMADRNFLIEKSVEQNNTVSKIREITNDDLINEISRLSGGIKSKRAFEHALELKENALKFKRSLKERKRNV